MVDGGRVGGGRGGGGGGDGSGGGDAHSPPPLCYRTLVPPGSEGKQASWRLHENDGPERREPQHPDREDVLGRGDIPSGRWWSVVVKAVVMVVAICDHWLLTQLNHHRIGNHSQGRQHPNSQ